MPRCGHSYWSVNVSATSMPHAPCSQSSSTYSTS
jgi:hypothetical protein